MDNWIAALLTLAISLVWEATLALPYQWWGYRAPWMTGVLRRTIRALESGPCAQTTGQHLRERWQSGRSRRLAKPLKGEYLLPGVRIPPSPKPAPRGNPARRRAVQGLRGDGTAAGPIG